MALPFIYGACRWMMAVCSIPVMAYGQNPQNAAPNTFMEADARYGGFVAKVTGSIRSGVTTLVRDEALLWSSPLRSGRGSLNTILPIAIITGAALSVDGRVAAGLPNSADQVRYSKAVSISGAYYSLGAVAAAFAGVGALTRNRRAIETGLIAAQAVAHTESIAQMLKYAAGRERPDFHGASKGHFWRGQQSFPSGHAMGTWALAAVISKQYSHNRLVRYGIYALPVLVSASRIGARRHFLADVVAGGSVGYLMGAWLQERHHTQRMGRGFTRVPRCWLSLRPAVRYDQRWGGVGLVVNLTR